MALNNPAVLETYLKNLILTKEAILATVDSREHIFEIKDHEKSLGFISLYDLKAYIYEHEEEATHYSIKNIDADEWKDIYEHPFFQRRKPQLVSPQNLKDLDDLEFFILQKGQKTGPFERDELMDKIEKREILLSDMVSFNGGHTWVKLFRIDGFERRSLKESDHLPGMPSSELLNRPSDLTNNISDTTDAITSLAFLGNQRKGKTLEQKHEISYKEEMEKGARSTSIYKRLLVTSVIGILFFLFNIRSYLSTPFLGNEQASVGEQAEVHAPVDSFNKNSFQGNNEINDQKRMEKFETRKMKPVKPVIKKSFMESKKFKQSNSDAETSGEDSNYYYDNNTPMELDPVRAQISKENFDNGGATAPAPETDNLFNQEVSH